MDKSDTKTGSRSILGCVCSVEKIGEEETDELEGHRDHAVPDEREYGSYR
jgi:hypothetical protein